MFAILPSDDIWVLERKQRLVSEDAVSHTRERYSGVRNMRTRLFDCARFADELSVKLGRYQMSRIEYDPQYTQENGDFGSALTLIAVVRFEQFVLFFLPCTCSRGCRFWLLEFWNIYHGLSKCTVIIGSHFGSRL